MIRVQEIKKQVVRKVLPKWQHVTEEYWPVVSSFAFSYSAGRTIIDCCSELGLTPDSSRVLIVGAFGGRDYHWLTGFGYKVDVLDLGHHGWGESDYLGDACKPETWEQIAEKYDLVVVCDVLEHLPEDFAALCHIRSVLTNRGHLYLSIPYSHDPGAAHVRSYSYMTLNRLLAVAGYKMVWSRHRPGLLEAFPRCMNIINYGLATLMLTPMAGASMLKILLSIEYVINEKTRHLYKYIGRSPQKGLTLAAKPIDEHDALNYVELNRGMFIREAAEHEKGVAT